MQYRKFYQHHINFNIKNVLHLFSRVGNTDAEGRMAMVDVLARCKEMAVGQPDPHLFTVATLTGHAVLG